MKKDENTFSIVPRQEARCVWMTAGVLSYQLCDRNYECENCLLDIALRREHGKHHSDRIHPEVHARGTSSGEKLNPEMLYSSNHCWVRRVHDRYLRVGLEPVLAGVLHSLRGIALPSCGQPVCGDQPAGWILFSHGTLPLYAPVAGRVMSVNTTLLSDPMLISRSPAGEGWLFELIPDSPEKYGDTLMNSESADLAFKKDLRSFHDTLSSTLSSNVASVGPTLMDGGTPLDDIPEIIGHEKYLEIVKSIFIRPK